MSAVTAFRPGIHRHHKGALYRALSLARLSEHRDVIVVVYFGLTPKEGCPEEESYRLWVRPLATPGEDSWTDVVTWPDLLKRPRFCFIETGV